MAKWGEIKCPRCADWEAMPNPDGFTPALKEICAEACAEYGEPPCWRLPDLIQPCEHITPCEECLAAIREGGE